MVIKPGNYKTRSGKRASVYHWGKNALGKECWVGTIEGVGTNTWDKKGKDLGSYSEYDIVESKK